MEIMVAFKDELCYKLIKMMFTCDKKLFISHLTLLCIMHVCFLHQGDLILRDDISLRHLTFNNIKCNIYMVHVL